MKNELFGVFGDLESFTQLRSPGEFDVVIDEGDVTVGIRDSKLETPRWSAVHTCEEGMCVVFGEVHPRGGGQLNAAQWLFDQYMSDGDAALSALNGSYLTVLSTPGHGFVATDPVRSRECFYSDVHEGRVFGTDSVAVARTIPAPRIRDQGLLEFLHLGVILGEKTILEQLRRLPMDSRLTPDAVEPLDRFVYEPRRFEYVEDLAERMKRAFERRASFPGDKGLLLSAGYDSRTLLMGIPAIERCYTVGSKSDQEVQRARRVAEQYGSNHVVLNADGRYLYPDKYKVHYSQGIKESLHIHHAGYTDTIDVDVMYHGLLCDTLMSGHFTAAHGIEIFGNRVPFTRPDPDPDPVESLLPKLGYNPGPSRILSSQTSFDIDPDRFVRSAVAEEFEKSKTRAHSVQNRINACGIGNQPSMPFHTHLVDNFVAPFFALDAEILDWHLSTPIDERNNRTFFQACKRLDGDIFRYRPPDRPHESTVLNELEGFIRRKTPFVSSFESPWPDRESIYDRYCLNRRLLPDLENVHENVPTRYKLRIHDIIGWLEQSSPQCSRAVTRRLRL